MCLFPSEYGSRDAHGGLEFRRVLFRSPCGGGSMIATMTSEWHKITTTKMWWLLALVMFAYMAFLGAVLGFSLTQSTAPTGPGMGGGGVPSGLESAQATYTVGASLGYVFPLTVGALAMTGEFRVQTITPTLLYPPLRSQVLFARLAEIGSASSRAGEGQ